MSAKTRTVLVLVLIALIAAAALNWPIVYAYLIDPIARVAWLLIRLFMAVDQEVFWILLIFIGFVLTALMVPNRAETDTLARKESPSLSSDRVRAWTSLIESAASDSTSRSALLQNLEQLQKNVRALVRGDDLDKTHTIPEKPAFQSASAAITVQQTLRRWFWRVNKTIDPDLVEQVDQFITSLEKDLEISDDNPFETNDLS